MPIYEFYCPDCHTVFSFLARAPRAGKRPNCPRCARPRLERRASPFAVSRGRGAAADDTGPSTLPDEASLERVLSDVARSVEGAPDDDPRRMAGMMRKLLGGSGLRLGQNMDEALQRLEAGEDPERIDEELGQGPAGEDEPWIEAAGGPAQKVRRRPSPPAVDDQLYEL